MERRLARHAGALLSQTNSRFLAAIRKRRGWARNDMRVGGSNVRAEPTTVRGRCRAKARFFGVGPIRGAAPWRRLRVKSPARHTRRERRRGRPSASLGASRCCEGCGKNRRRLMGKTTPSILAGHSMLCPYGRKAKPTADGRRRGRHACRSKGPGAPFTPNSGAGGYCTATMSLTLWIVPLAVAVTSTV